MNCNDVRDRLGEIDGAPTASEVREHLEACSDCARHAARIEAALRSFRGHHAEIEPDAAFATRVVARLPVRPTETLGWAAARLLPATLVLLIVLGWMAWQMTSAPADLVSESPTDDLLSWVVSGNGNGS